MSPFDTPLKNFRSIAACACVFFISALAPRGALANGRYPLSQQLLVDPSDPGHLFLRSTYGVLASADAGSTWSWLCESGIGYDPGEDPMMAIADGGVLAGAPEGLFTTHDRGCTWPKDETIGDIYVADLATERDATTVLATTVSVMKDGRYEGVLWRSTDAAMTWKSLGDLTAGSVLPFTLDAAPSNPQRVYVTAAALPPGSDAGASHAQGVLLSSTDGGATFTESPIPGTDRNDMPLIGAIDPTNPDVVYVRVRGQWDQANPVQSWLLYTSDAGKTWKEVFRANADMLGFAVSPDGQTVLVGMGNTRDILRPVDTTVVGLYHADASALSFSRMSTGQVGCLTYSGNQLYVCGSQETVGYELGVSNDDGATISPLFEYGTVKGPLECPASSPQTMVCAPQWPTACRGLGSCPHVDAGTHTPTTGSGGSSSGCCGSATAQQKSQTGTAQLDMFGDLDGAWLTVTALLAGAIRRFTRRRVE